MLCLTADNDDSRILLLSLPSHRLYSCRSMDSFAFSLPVSLSCFNCSRAAGFCGSSPAPVVFLERRLLRWHRASLSFRICLFGMCFSKVLEWFSNLFTKPLGGFFKHLWRKSGNRLCVSIFFAFDWTTEASCTAVFALLD